MRSVSDGFSFCYIDARFERALRVRTGIKSRVLGRAFGSRSIARRKNSHTPSSQLPARRSSDGLAPDGTDLPRVEKAGADAIARRTVRARPGADGAGP